MPNVVFPQCSAEDESWLEALLFDPKAWQTVKRPSPLATDQATVLALAKNAGLRATTVASPRAGVSIYTNAPQNHSMAVCLATCSDGDSKSSLVESSS